MNQKASISPLQLFIIFINTSIGAGILTFPRSVAEIAKQDMWLSTIAGGILMFMALWTTLRLSHFFPEHTSMEYNSLLLGPTLGTVINIFQICLLLGLAAQAVRTFAFAIKLFLFDVTPQPVFVASILLVAGYAAQYGYAPLLRMQQVSFLFSYVVFISLLLLGLLDISIEPFLPVFAEGIIPILKGTVPSWFAFSGPELIAGLLFPYLSIPRTAIPTGAASIALITVIYLLIVVIAQGSLTAAGAEHTIFPTVIAFRNIEISDTFIERLDGYLMIIWICIYFNSLANLLFFSAFAIGRLLRQEYSRSLILLLLPLLYYISQLAPTLEDHLVASAIFTIVCMVFSLGVMPILLLFAWYKYRGNHHAS